jgi:hypothetical protein
LPGDPRPRRRPSRSAGQAGCARKRGPRSVRPHGGESSGWGRDVPRLRRPEEKSREGAPRLQKTDREDRGGAVFARQRPGYAVP